MGEPARKIDDETLPDSAPLVAEDGVVLTPEEEDELDQALAEAEADLRAGRVHTADEIRAKLRTA
jgi:hypothetical protein